MHNRLRQIHVQLQLIYIFLKSMNPKTWRLGKDTAEIVIDPPENEYGGMVNYKIRKKFQQVQGQWKTEKNKNISRRQKKENVKFYDRPSGRMLFSSIFVVPTFYR